MLRAAAILLFDTASTIVFLGILLITRNPPLATVLGMLLGVGQIAWQLVAKRPVDSMQAISLVLVLASGTASLITRDPRFVMLKPSLIYLIVGAAMLRPGWMNRYMPGVATEFAADVGMVFGFIWSGLMFASAGLNLIVARQASPIAWGAFMSAYAIASKAALFLIQYGVTRTIARRRRTRAALAVQVRGVP